MITQGDSRGVEITDINEKEENELDNEVETIIEANYNRSSIIEASDEEEEYKSTTEDESQRCAESVGDINENQDELDHTQPSRRLWDKRTLRPPERYAIWANANELLVANSNEPQSYSEA